jgi:hypothetical protein
MVGRLEVLHVGSVVADSSDVDPVLDKFTGIVAAVIGFLHVHFPDLLFCHFGKNSLGLSFLESHEFVPKTFFVEDSVNGDVKEGVHSHVALGNVVEHGLPFDPDLLQSSISGDSVNLSHNLGISVTEHDLSIDGFHADVCEVSQGRFLDIHDLLGRVDSIDTNETLSGAHCGTFHGDVDLHESDEASLLGFESGELLDVIHLDSLFKLGFDVNSGDFSPLLEFDLSHHFLVGLKSIVEVFFGLDWCQEFHPVHNGLVEGTPVLLGRINIGHDGIGGLGIVTGSVLKESSSELLDLVFTISQSTVHGGIQSHTDLDNFLQNRFFDGFTVLHEPLGLIFSVAAVHGVESTVLEELTVPFINGVDIESHTEHGSGDALGEHISEDLNHIAHLSRESALEVVELLEMSVSLGNEHLLLGNESSLDSGLTFGGKTDVFGHKALAEGHVGGGGNDGGIGPFVSSDSNRLERVHFAVISSDP